VLFGPAPLYYARREGRDTQLFIDTAENTDGFAMWRWGDAKMARAVGARSALGSLRGKERDLQARLDHVQEVLRKLARIATGKSLAAAPGRRTRTLSPEGRRAIAQAAKRRWAAYRRERAAGVR
jgi:hypothetical protein